MTHLRHPLTPLAVLEHVSEHRISNLQVFIRGDVAVILSDDTEGDRHQRFVIKLPNEQTILIVHNIDITPRVSDLAIGDEVYVYGEYEWNFRGGLVHWTHRDPNSEHLDGWIEHHGKVFE